MTSLLFSDDEDNRTFDVDVILQIRKGKMLRCQIKNPQEAKINREGLINWNVYIHKCKLSIDKLKQLRHCPSKVPKYSVDPQSCERAVNEGAISTQAVYDRDRRMAG